MIAIVNIDKNVRDSGSHLYELRVNQKVICKFSHDREQSLDICLMKAAEAYKMSIKDKEEAFRKVIENIEWYSKQ